jgi:phage shock protein C
MFCTKCGTELKDQGKFCSECGTSTGRGAPTTQADRLSRPVTETKIAGVCAGFARYFGVDVTLVRVIWLVLCVWPVPLFGIISYFVAWIVMPKDPLVVPAANMHPANGHPANG